MTDGRGVNRAKWDGLELNIRINGRNCWTLFDSGARRTYIVAEASKSLISKSMPVSSTVQLGGRVHKINRSCVLDALIEEYIVNVVAFVTDEIGKDEDGKQIEVLFGATAMQDWGIELDLANERLDMTNYPGEFAEF